MLSVELGNLRGAWSYWVREGAVAQLDDLLDVLWAFYDQQGNYREAVDLGRDLLGVLSLQPETSERIRDEIADEYGEPYAQLAVLLNDVRGWAKGTLPTYQDRKDFFDSIVNGDPDPVELLRREAAGDLRDHAHDRRSRC